MPSIEIKKRHKTLKAYWLSAVLPKSLTRFYVTLFTSNDCVTIH